MKRLLCVLSCMNAGGAETFLMKLYRKIDRDAYQFDFAVNIREEGVYDKEIKFLGGKIYHFPPKSESFWGYIKGLKKIVQDNHYEYVLRITSNGMGFLDLAIAKFAGAKVCIARSSNSSDGYGIKSCIAHFVGKTIFKRFVDVKIAPSTEAAIYTFGEKDVNSGKVCLLPNGIDLNYYKYDENFRKTIRDEFGLSSKTFVVGHVGRFSEQKNHSFLIDVFATFLKKHPNSKLLLVGNGELMPMIKQRCESLGVCDNVIFTGIRSDMPNLYSAMDVFLFPSLFEGMPNVVIEAQACGLPCVIADSITKEANVTENVKYLPLNEGLREWENAIGECVGAKRGEAANMLRKNGYDINDVVKKFERTCFF